MSLRAHEALVCSLQGLFPTASSEVRSCNTDGGWCQLYHLAPEGSAPQDKTRQTASRLNPGVLEPESKHVAYSTVSLDEDTEQQVETSSLQVNKLPRQGALCGLFTSSWRIWGPRPMDLLLHFSELFLWRELCPWQAVASQSAKMMTGSRRGCFKGVLLEYNCIWTFQPHSKPCKGRQDTGTYSEIFDTPVTCGFRSNRTGTQ